MKPDVYILATVRHPDLLDAALLVFKTLRIGFPSSRICVHGNALSGASRQAVAQAARLTGSTFANQPLTVHDLWIEQIMDRATTPFWICDTDVVFLGNVESMGRGTMSGRLEPEWYCDWTGAVHVERLHTCLLYFDPVAIRSKTRAWMSGFPKPWADTVQQTLVRQTLQQYRGKTILYDTCAGLYQAIGGRPFTEAENDRFEHLGAATYVDRVDSPSMAGLATVHNAVYEDLSRASGLRKTQAEYYRTHQPDL